MEYVIRIKATRFADGPDLQGGYVLEGLKPEIEEKTAFAVFFLSGKCYNDMNDSRSAKE